jgi:hypothetical protein
LGFGENQCSGIALQAAAAQDGHRAAHVVQ